MDAKIKRLHIGSGHQADDDHGSLHRKRPGPKLCSCGATIIPTQISYLGGSTRWILADTCEACSTQKEDEWRAEQKSRRIQQLRQASRLPVAANKAYISELDPAYMGRQGRGVQAVRRWRYEQNPSRNAEPWCTWRAPYFWSACGLGKTTFACVLANRVIGEMQRPALFVSTTDLLHQQRAAYRNGGAADLIDRAQAVFFLVLDDLGGQSMTPWVLENLFWVVDERLKARRPTCITSNYDPASLAEVLVPKGQDGEKLAPTATALADRVIGLCIPVRLGDDQGKGESIRLSEAQKRQAHLF